MPSSYFAMVFRFLLLFLMGSGLYAQPNGTSVGMELQNDASVKDARLVTFIVVLKNLTSQGISGRMIFTLPKGFRSVSGAGLDVDLQPLQTRYVPVKFMIGSDAAAGGSTLVFKYVSHSGALLVEKSAVHTIGVNNALELTPLLGTIYRSSSEAPLTIQVKVSNLGNVVQNVTVICKFPDPTTSRNFSTQSGIVGVNRDSIFTFTYVPSSVLAAQSRYQVGVFGMRNPERDSFGSSTVLVQNTASVQLYQQFEFASFSEETHDYVTSSYRALGSNASIFQLSGSGSSNLPFGSVLFTGNLALINNQNDPLVTNTRLRFAQRGNTFTMGTINQLLDMPLVGRGATFSHFFERDRKIEVGFVDQNYNLVSKESWLKNGYGFFTQSTLYSGQRSRLGGAYVYRSDPFERARHHILGSDFHYLFNSSWDWNAKINGGLSAYEGSGNLKPSFAAESNYSGTFKNIRLNGNYYGSSNYYPGNRRGSMQFQQQVTAELKGNILQASAIFSDFSPRFHLYNSTQKSTNAMLEFGNRFPNMKDFIFGMSYQFQRERSNSYSSFFGGVLGGDFQSLLAHRLIERLSWVSAASRQSAVLTVENGFVRPSNSSDSEFQLKLNGTYGFRNLSFTSVYQHGSYYLSEYAFSRQLGEGNPYSKLNLSLFYNAQFMGSKLVLNSGAAYTEDSVYGTSPSVFLHTKYNGRLFNLFLNSSWYNYSSNFVDTDLLTIELGVTVHLGKTILNPNKKGTLKVLAFYDLNHNNIFDEGEKVAPNFNITLGAVVLKTDLLGRAFYKRVPFGSYALKQLAQDGWFYEDSVVLLDGYSQEVIVPLHQSGAIRGKVVFAYNSKTDYAFENGGSRISFSVLKDNQLLKKIYTDDAGVFTSFLPTGNYTLLLDEQSLPAHTFSANKGFAIEVTSGAIFTVPTFTVSVQEKKINTKKFSN